MQKIQSNNLGLHYLPSIAAITLSCASLHALALGTEDHVFSKPLHTEFKQLDANNDSKLTQKEIADDQDFTKGFSTADRNEDGILAFEEYSRFKSRAQQRRIETYLDDTTVTAKIKAELIRDAGMKGMDISVETYKGEVILSGFVETHQQLRRAMQIASGVRGVTAIKNGLVIRS